MAVASSHQLGEEDVDWVQEPYILTEYPLLLSGTAQDTAGLGSCAHDVELFFLILECAMRRLGRA